MLIIRIVSAVICSMLAMRMVQRALDMIGAKYRTTWAMLLMEPLNTVHSLVQDEWIMHMAVRSNTA